MKGVIILDLGASCHMINNNILMSNHRKIKNKSLKITGFNGSSDLAIGLGDIGIFKDVLLINNIPNSIISPTNLSNSGYMIFQSNSELYILVIVTVR